MTVEEIMAHFQLKGKLPRGVKKQGLGFSNFSRYFNHILILALVCPTLPTFPFLFPDGTTKTKLVY